MKIETKLATVLVLCGIIFGLLALISIEVHADSRKRFEHLLTQTHTWDDSTNISRFEVWHDTESGIEFVCSMAADYGNAVSCFPTGRSWK